MTWIAKTAPLRRRHRPHHEETRSHHRNRPPPPHRLRPKAVSNILKSPLMFGASFPTKSCKTGHQSKIFTILPEILIICGPKMGALTHRLSFVPDNPPFCSGLSRNSTSFPSGSIEDRSWNLNETGKSCASPASVVREDGYFRPCMVDWFRTRRDRIMRLGRMLMCPIMSARPPIHMKRRGNPMDTQKSDANEHFLAEQRLRESEERYRAIAELTGEWIWTMDLEGRHTSSNAVFQTILGHSLEEFLGKPALLFMHPDDRARVEAELPSLFAEKRGWRRWIVRWRHRDGSYRYLESNAEPMFDATGQLPTAT